MNAPAKSAMPADLSGLSNAELRKLENKIARRHSGMFPWLMVCWAFGNLAFWLSLWPLVLLGIMPLWLGFILATISLSLVYLPTHDAQHDIIARPGQKLRWLNELLGHATTWMIVSPFNVFRVTHLEHHRHANDPELDPDIASKAPGPWSAIWKSIRERQPSGTRSANYLQTLERVGRSDLILLAIAYQLSFSRFCSHWRGAALRWRPCSCGGYLTISR